MCGECTGGLAMAEAKQRMKKQGSRIQNQNGEALNRAVLLILDSCSLLLLMAKKKNPRLQAAAGVFCVS
jgi:hypothetical protein